MIAGIIRKLMSPYRAKIILIISLNILWGNLRTLLDVFNGVCGGKRPKVIKSLVLPPYNSTYIFENVVNKNYSSSDWIKIEDRNSFYNKLISNFRNNWRKSSTYFELGVPEKLKEIAVLEFGVSTSLWERNWKPDSHHLVKLGMIRFYVMENLFGSNGSSKVQK